MTNPKHTPTEERRWLDDKRNVDKIFWGLMVVCAGLVVADFFYHKHSFFAIEDIPGFYVWFGFLVCVGLVLAAKEMRKVLMRDEDYYD